MATDFLTANPAADSPEAIPQFLLDSTAPLQEAPFSLEHLESHARSLAATHAVVASHEKEAELWERFESNRESLEAAYDQIVAAVGDGEEITPGAEWLLDNFYVVREQLTEITQDLPRRFYRELPEIGVAFWPVLHASMPWRSRSSLTPTARSTNRCSLVSSRPIRKSLRSAWAKFGQCRSCSGWGWSRICVGWPTRSSKRNAIGAAAKPGPTKSSRTSLPTVPGLLAERTKPLTALAAPLVAHLDQRFRDQGHDLSVCWHWLQEHLADRGGSIDEIVRQEHQRQACGAGVDRQRHHQHAADLGAGLDGVFRGNQPCRTRTSPRPGRRLWPNGFRARATTIAMSSKAWRGGRGCRRSKWRSERSSRRFKRQKIPPRGHIGYYLIDDGRAEFEASLGMDRTPLARMRQTIARHPGLVYFRRAARCGLPCLPRSKRLRRGAVLRSAILILLAVVAWIPASEVAVAIVNYLTSLILSPRVLPKMDFKDGVPASARTIVVVPSLLLSQECLRGLLQRLEIHYLANPDPELAFALLTDFVDAPRKKCRKTRELLAAALEGIRELNRRYPEGGKTRFWLFQRGRRWNPIENKWMGWERKRGKISEFNRLLRGATGTTYLVPARVPSELVDVRFVITLDADTQLPLGTARRLVSTIAHPLNRPHLGSRPASIERGYAILQPRICISPVSANQIAVRPRLFRQSASRSLRHRGVGRISGCLRRREFYRQGHLRSGRFRNATESAFPENHILSHDLIEGCLARAALVTDAELIDAIPRSITLMRGVSIVGCAAIGSCCVGCFPSCRPSMRRGRNPLSLVSWWKIFDNLRRSVVPPSLLLLAGGGLAGIARAGLGLDVVRRASAGDAAVDPMRRRF